MLHNRHIHKDHNNYTFNPWSILYKKVRVFCSRRCCFMMLLLLIITHSSREWRKKITPLKHKLFISTRGRDWLVVQQPPSLPPSIHPFLPPTSWVKRNGAVRWEKGSLAVSGTGIQSPGKSSPTFPSGIVCRNLTRVFLESRAWGERKSWVVVAKDILLLKVVLRDRDKSNARMSVKFLLLCGSF